MKCVKGWWGPDLLSGPGSYLGRWEQIQPLIADIGPRRSAVQAGAHIGIWPVGIAQLFERVYCAEPDAENWAALQRNLQRRANGSVFPMRALFGAAHGPLGMYRSLKSTGQHRVRGAGDFPVLRIDDLGLTDCDLICLDVEGFEIPALRGAEQTIKASRPVIIAEENRRAIEQGYQIGDLEVWLSGLGYHLSGAVGEDLIFEGRK